MKNAVGREIPDQLLADGKTLEETKEMKKNENIFGAPTAARANQIFVTVSGRIKTLDASFAEVFQRSDVAMQKIFVLVSSLAYDSLFFEFGAKNFGDGF